MTDYDEIAAEMNERMKNGEYECPSCGNEVGLMLRASCAECGHIPEENRATASIEE